VARQPEHLADQQRALGRYLAALREAVGLYQVDIARAVPCHRTTVTHAEAGSQLPASDFWKIADRVVSADGALIARYDELIHAKAAHLAEQQAKRRARAQMPTPPPNQTNPRLVSHPPPRRLHHLDHPQRTPLPLPTTTADRPRTTHHTPDTRPGPAPTLLNPLGGSNLIVIQM
jgi:Helix-turn-helix domain